MPVRPRRHDPGGRRVDPQRAATAPHHWRPVAQSPSREISRRQVPSLPNLACGGGCRWAAGEARTPWRDFFLDTPPAPRTRTLLCQNCCDRAVIKMGGAVARAATSRLDGAHRRPDRRPWHVAPAPPHPPPAGGEEAPPPDGSTSMIVNAPSGGPPAAALGRAPGDPTAAGRAFAARMRGTVTRAIRNSVVAGTLIEAARSPRCAIAGGGFSKGQAPAQPLHRAPPSPADQPEREISSQRTNRGHPPNRVLSRKRLRFVDWLLVMVTCAFAHPGHFFPF